MFKKLIAAHQLKRGIIRIEPIQVINNKENIEGIERHLTKAELYAYVKHTSSGITSYLVDEQRKNLSRDIEVARETRGPEWLKREAVENVYYNYLPKKFSVGEGVPAELFGVFKYGFDTKIRIHLGILNGAIVIWKAFDLSGAVWSGRQPSTRPRNAKECVIWLLGDPYFK